MWISIPEACRITQRGYSVIWRKLLRGELRSRRQGAKWLVLKGDVEKLARRLREGVAAEAGAAR